MLTWKRQLRWKQEREKILLAKMLVGGALWVFYRAQKYDMNMNVSYRRHGFSVQCCDGNRFRAAVALTSDQLDNIELIFSGVTQTHLQVK